MNFSSYQLAAILHDLAAIFLQKPCDNAADG